MKASIEEIQLLYSLLVDVSTITSFCDYKSQTKQYSDDTDYVGKTAHRMRDMISDRLMKILPDDLSLSLTRNVLAKVKEPPSTPDTPEMEIETDGFLLEEESVPQAAEKKTAKYN